jgi:hypothetical protein
MFWTHGRYFRFQNMQGISDMLETLAAVEIRSPIITLRDSVGKDRHKWNLKKILLYFLNMILLDLENTFYSL